MIQLEQISKAFGGQVLFRDLTWHIARGERIGLVGPNGAGKTTLCRILTGAVGVDSGQVRRARSVAIGYLPQEVAGPREGTVLGHLLAAFPEVRRLEGELELLAAEMADAHGAPGDLLCRYGDLQHRFEALDGYGLEARAKAILGGLGFRPEDFFAPLMQFSGGWRMRVALGRLLLQAPDLLLLDEPTNHLDLESLRWLEEFLDAYQGTAVVISHDRYFLNRVVDRVAELERGRFALYAGDYDEYQAQKVARQEQLEAALRLQAEQIEKTERFIRKFRYQATRARQVQSRIKMLDRMDRAELIRAPKRMHFRFPQPARSGATICELRAIRKAYGDNVVYRGVDFRLLRGDRVALVGANGAGKSTLLKIVAGVLPFEGGDRTLGHNVSLHYYAQHQLDALNPRNTVLEELALVADLGMQPRLRTILGAFLFSGDEVEKPVAVLSGGEKSRLALAKMLLRPANLLCLDEPTNHLDVTARDVLEEALEQFEGSMFFISHDRYFINRMATKVVEVRGGRLWEFVGDYDTYLEKREAGQPERRLEPQSSSRLRRRTPESPSPEAPRSRARQARQAEAAAGQQRRQETAALRARLKELESEIAGIEARLRDFSDQMANPDLYRDGERAREVVREQKALEERAASLYGKWEELALRLEQATANRDS